jgi:hypothetical protein
MSKRLIAVAAGLTLVVGYPALAAEKHAQTKPTAETCKSLEAQVDSAAKTHANAPKYKEAMSVRAEGSKLCEEGKYSEGAAKLQVALKDLGVKTTKTH